MQFGSFRPEQFRIDAQGFDLCDIIVIHFPVADHLQQAAVQGLLLVHQHTVGIFCRPDDPGNAFRGFRTNLRAVLAVNLVTVVLGRIMACRDHNAGRGVQVAYSIAEYRHRTKRVKQEGRDALRTEHQCCILREFSAAAPAVIRDDNAALRVFRFFEQISGQAFCSPADVVFVHPVGSGSKHAAHSRGAEAQVRIESVFQFLFIIPDCLQFPDRFRIVGKILQPLMIVFKDRHTITAFLSVACGLPVRCLRTDIYIIIIIFFILLDKPKPQKPKGIRSLCHSFPSRIQTAAAIPPSWDTER